MTYNVSYTLAARGKNTLRGCVTWLSLAALACVVAGGPVAAQTTANEVIVEAPRSVTTTDQNDKAMYPGGAQVEVTTMKASVRYADLDLARPSDVAVLQSRIMAAATEACKQLGQRYPLTPDQNCLHKAVITTTTQVERAIVAAER